MENRKDIGKAFRDKLDLLENAPDGALWNRIEADVQKKRKRRHLLWVFSIIGILSIGSLVVRDSITDNTFFKDNFSTSTVTNSSEATNRILLEDHKNDISTVVDAKGSSKFSNEDRESFDNIRNDDKKAVVKSRAGNTENTEAQLYSSDKKVGSDNSVSVDSDSKFRTKHPSKFRRDVKGNLPAKKSQNKSKGKFNFNELAKHHIKNGRKKTKQANVPYGDTAESLKEAQNHVITETFNSIPDSAKLAEQLDGTISNIIADVSQEKKDSLNQKPENKNKLKKDEQQEEKTTAIKSQANMFASLFYGPTISGSLSVKSLVNNSFNSNNKENALTSSYGISLGVKPGKLGVRIGLTKINLENNLSIKNNGENLISDYSNIALDGGTTPQEINDYFSDADNVTLTQKVSYLEVPIEIMYTVFNKNKFGVDALLGAGVTVLNKNNISLSANNEGEMSIGKIDNLTKLNFASHLGIGLNYKLTKKLQFDITPMFKYFHNIGNEYYKPYSLSLQSGFSYRF